MGWTRTAAGCGTRRRGEGAGQDRRGRRPWNFAADMARMIKSEDEAEKQPQEAAAVEEAPRKRASRKPARAGEAADGPDPFLAKLERAEQLASAGSHADAAEAFQAVATGQPENLRAALGLGSALAAQGKYDAAE